MSALTELVHWCQSGAEGVKAFDPVVGDELLVRANFAARELAQIREALESIISWNPNERRALEKAETALALVKDDPAAPTGVVPVPVERLREIEWQHDSHSPDFCPVCQRIRDLGHSDDCWLATALHDAGKEEPCPRN